jgi:hypothetical protein
LQETRKFRRVAVHLDDDPQPEHARLAIAARAIVATQRVDLAALRTVLA